MSTISNTPDNKGTVLVLGGDGFCGWPTSLYLSRRGYKVIIVDNLSRRDIDLELGVTSLTPITSMQERVQAWKDVAQKNNADWQLEFHQLNIATQYPQLVELLQKERPHTIYHFAEQRSAPYSMKTSSHKLYTVQNNLSATTAILCAIVDVDPNIHLIHLGTMGVYGYSCIKDLLIPEGYLDVLVPTNNQGIQELHPMTIVYPSNPGSVYHATKCQDHILFQYFAKNDRLRITDLHQGIVWGSKTDECSLDERLINRFDWEGDYGTVLNRFIIQSALDLPMTVYGKQGGQTRGFINIRDAMKCFELALLNPPQRGDRVMVRNQVTETHTIGDLAKMLCRVRGKRWEDSVVLLDNPRNEAEVNSLVVDNSSFLRLNLNPVGLQDSLIEEVTEIAQKYAYRIRHCQHLFMPQSIWSKEGREGKTVGEKAVGEKSVGEKGLERKSVEMVMPFRERVDQNV